MARKQEIGIGLLPSGRAIRVAKFDVRIMQEITKRVSRKFPEEKGKPKPTKSEIAVEMENETVAMCVKGITLAPVKLAYKDVPADSPEVPPALRQSGPDAPMVKVVDVDATLKPYADPASDEFKRWTPLNEMVLANEDDDLSMFVLFGEPSEWAAIVSRIEHHGGGAGGDPFAGKLVRTSAG